METVSLKAQSINLRKQTDKSRLVRLTFRTFEETPRYSRETYIVLHKELQTLHTDHFSGKYSFLLSLSSVNEIYLSNSFLALK
jgi:hypothetical protein